MWLTADAEFITTSLLPVSNIPKLLRELVVQTNVQLLKLNQAFHPLRHINFSNTTNIIGSYGEKYQ